MLSVQAAAKPKGQRTAASHTDTKHQMENEVLSLRKELESTRNALKIQAARCRNLVAAFTKRLAERDAEVNYCRELRDKQLSQVLRALLALEARLRREQKSIRAQLSDRDSIISNQQLEIERLKASVEKAYAEVKIEAESVVETRLPTEEAAHTQPEVYIKERECYVKPDLISSLGIDGEMRLEEDSPTPSLSYDERSSQYDQPPDSLSSDSASTRSCLGDTSDSDFTCGPSSSPQMKGILSVHNRSAFSPISKSFQKHATENVKSASPQDKNHNLPKDYDSDGVKPTSDDSDGKDEICTRSVKHLPSALLQEVRIGTRHGDHDEYQDNPVLQCVNQILLKDQEDFLEEQRSLRLRGVDPDTPEHTSWLSADCEDGSSADDQQDSKKLKRSPSPGKKAMLHHQEKACLAMSNRLSLARVSDFEAPEAPQMTKHGMDGKKSVSLTDLTKSKFTPRANPPLPPKPNRLSGGKRVEFAIEKRNIKPTTVEFHNPPMVLPPPQPVRIDTPEIDIINKQPLLPLSILDPMDQGPDNELYVISNSALDDDIVQHLQGRMVNGSGLDITLNSQRLGNDNVPLHTRTQHSNLPNGLLHPNHKTKNKGMSNNINLFSTTNGLFSNNLSPTKENNNANGILKYKKHKDPKINNLSFKSPPKASITNTIKVASPVATLLTSGKAQEASGQGSPEVSPSVSQIVRRFEDLGSKKLSPGTEEGESEDFSMEQSQTNGEKEESNAEPSDTPPTVSYDTFLEATGLSQKSIMTPSRMLSNHKSVMKPKDVKHRSRIKAAAEKCIPAQVVGPTIKYWMEPYL